MKIRPPFRKFAQAIYPFCYPYRNALVALLFLTLFTQAFRLWALYNLGMLLKGFGDPSERHYYTVYLLYTSAIAVAFTYWTSIKLYRDVLYPLEQCMPRESLEKGVHTSMNQLVNQDRNEALNTVQRGHQALRESFDRMITALAPMFWNSVFLFVVLFRQHWQVGIIGFTGLCLYLAESVRLNGKSWWKMLHHRKLGEQAEYRFQDKFRLWRQIKAANEEDAAISKNEREFGVYTILESRLWVGHLLKSLVGKEALALATFGGLLFVSEGLYARGTINSDSVVASITVGLSLLYSMADFGKVQRALMQSSVLLRKYRKFLLEPTPSPEGFRIACMPDFRGDIVFENVSCRCLKNVSFRIKGGSMVVIMGASGIGKTTLGLLLCGYLIPESGRILIDGVDIRHIPPRTLFSNMLYVMQNPEFFSGETLRSNLTGHNGLSAMSDDDLVVAAQRFSFSSTIVKQRLHTVIGARGFRPSGGEMQRFALIRAMLLEPSVIVLDEPTSALDPMNDYLVDGAIRIAAKGRTCFVIAHKFKTAKMADVVVMMANGIDGNGKVVGVGTHDELLNGVEATNQPPCVDYAHFYEHDRYEQGVR